MPRRAAPSRQEPEPMAIIRDAILKMTWRELEGFAESLECERSEAGRQDHPISANMLNTWAQTIELEGDQE